jgi:hypothetical protein
VSHVKDAHSVLSMRVLSVKDGVLEESMRWWSDCITCNSKHQKGQYGLQYDVDKGTGKESTIGGLIDLDHHDGEGDHHDGARGWGRRSAKGN